MLKELINKLVEKSSKKETKPVSSNDISRRRDLIPMPVREEFLSDPLKLEKIDELKEFSSKLGICEEMYKEAYTIYDFRKAGRKDYMTEERLLELKRWYDTPTEDF